MDKSDVWKGTVKDTGLYVERITYFGKDALAVAKREDMSAVTLNAIDGVHAAPYTICEQLVLHAETENSVAWPWDS